MRNTDIAIVGGGLAGSLAGAMLARAGYDALVIDPHDVYPPDFRVEKLDDVQIATLEKTGLADVVRDVATPYHQLWIVKFGRVYENGPASSSAFTTTTWSTRCALKSPASPSFAPR